MGTRARVHNNINSTIKYLSPLLPFANCHMVEFFTQNHWEKFIPNDLKKYLEKCELNDAVSAFWKYAEGLVGMLYVLSRLYFLFITFNDLF